MLNREYILEAIRPYLTKDKKLRESDFNRLFSDLTRKEQYQIIEILIDADIDYVDDEASPPIDQKSIIDIFTEIESESIVETKKSHAAPKSTLGRDAKQLLGLKNEQLCALYQQGDPLALEALVLKNEKFVYRDALALSKQSLLNFQSRIRSIEGTVVSCVHTISIIFNYKRFKAFQDIFLNR